MAELPKLDYALNALEPYITEEIMDLHYNKHHKGYVTNLNAAQEKYEEAEKAGDIAAMIAEQSAVKFNGGGHINHSIFWTNLAPTANGGGEKPTGELAKEIDQEFGSLENFITQFNATAASIQGSGWAWLGYNKAAKRIEIATCSNQDPLVTKGLIPLLGIDVWEHAYYLQYKNARAEYLKAIWNVINWKNVSERYLKAKS